MNCISQNIIFKNHLNDPSGSYYSGRFENSDAWVGSYSKRKNEEYFEVHTREKFLEYVGAANIILKYKILIDEPNRHKFENRKDKFFVQTEELAQQAITELFLNYLKEFVIFI